MYTKMVFFINYPKNSNNLIYFIRQEVDEDYLKYTDEEELDLAFKIHKYGSLTYEIAYLVYKLLKERVKYSNETMYVFMHKWVEDGINLQYTSELIRTIVIPSFKQDIVNINTYLKNTQETIENTDFLQQLKLVQTTINIIIDKVQNGVSPHQRSMFISYFKDDEFYKKINSELYLIGFDNGYYNLKTSSFHEYTPDVVITQSVGYDYDDSVQDESELHVFLKQVFPDENILHYVLKLFASRLCGGNKDNLIVFFTGTDTTVQTGSNGKTSLMKLVKQVFGDYFCKGQVKLITSEIEDASSANSSLMALKDCRIANFEEPPRKGRVKPEINMEALKDWSGGGTVSARQLYKKQIEFYITFVVFVLANILPNLSSTDYGSRRRIRSIPFESKFVADISDEKYSHLKYVYPLDTDLDKKFKDWNMVFMKLLLNTYYSLYVSEGLGENVTPKRIMVFTDEYINCQTSELNEYSEDHIEFIDTENRQVNNTNYIKLSDIIDTMLHKSTIKEKYTKTDISTYFQTTYNKYYRKRTTVIKTENGFKIEKTERDIILHHVHHPYGISSKTSCKIDDIIQSTCEK